jgi:hypothetical protein
MTEKGEVKEWIVEKLRKRAAYLRKCFHENPSSMACLADELDRQAEEIEDCTVGQTKELFTPPILKRLREREAEMAEAGPVEQPEKKQ